MMTDAEGQVLKALRSRGFAVVVFNPDELSDANPDLVEDRLVELGWEVIGWLASGLPDNE